MNNMLYYCCFIDLLMDKRVIRSISSFIQNGYKKNNIFNKIYTKVYNPEKKYTEDIYVTWLNEQELVMLYCDNYSDCDILLYFTYNAVKKKIHLYGFGKEKNELYDKKNNYYVSTLLNKSGAKIYNITQPKTYYGYLDFFNKILINYWINDICLDMGDCTIYINYYLDLYPRFLNKKLFIFY